MASSSQRSPTLRRSPYPSPSAVYDHSPFGMRATSPVAQLQASGPSPSRSPATPATDVICMDTFQQILELDEDDTPEFSISMTQSYFSQAENTFRKMDKALAEKQLGELSDLGHFFKGSSAALGVTKVQASCERMQHYGKLRDEEAEVDITPEDALARITRLLAEIKAEYNEAEAWLRKYYADHGHTVP